ncbi:hypothetical protein AB1Y20_023585 [Prymnesium parvum]|uniref:Hexosyltransferase n=1 Tax=Prymnesium parvum TaxID=97485 RepID=A0AB34JF64_PRYPA
MESPEPLLLAIGVVSAPSFFERRMGVRASWMRWPEARRAAPVLTRFVVRSLGAPSRLRTLLALEASHHNDLLRVPVRWDESRVKGPVLCLAAWLVHAARHHRAARFVAKVDDDVYVHLPDLLRSLRPLHAAEAVQLGKLAWFHWHADIFEHEGFGWTYGQAHVAGRRCRSEPNASACAGPFPFATGFLQLLSAPLARFLAGSRVMDDDVRRLAAMEHVRKRNGAAQRMVMEDVWLGSLLHRASPPLPIRHVTFSELNAPTFVSDEWGFRATRTALLVHLRVKAAGRMLALHDFMTSAEHCGCATRLLCRQGCPAFLSEGERREASLVRALRGLRRHARLPEAILSRAATSGTISSRENRFCAGAQHAAHFCRIVPDAPPRSCCVCCGRHGECAWRNVSLGAVDFMPRVRQRALALRTRRLLNSSEAARYFKAQVRDQAHPDS